MDRDALMTLILQLTVAVAVVSVGIGAVTLDPAQVAVALAQVGLALAGLTSIRRGWGAQVVDAYMAVMFVVLAGVTWVTGGTASPYHFSFPLLAVVLVYLAGPWRGGLAVVVGGLTLLVQERLEAMGQAPGPPPHVLEAMTLLGLSGVLFAYYPKSQWLDAIAVARRQQQELAVALEEASRANTVKRRFLANMSHELRTPLNAILGYTELIAEESAAPEQRDDLARIQSSGQHLLALINDVLDLAKIEEGALTVEARVLGVQALVDEVVAGLASHRERHQGAFVVTVGPRVAAVRGDPVRVRQILFNLLTNAFRFAEGSEVRLEVEREGDQVAFRVVDRGVGIERSDLKRLFQPFEQLDDGVALGDGTGLGLALARQLARAMGGDVEVTSAPRQGSTFRLGLPAADAPGG